MSWEATTAVMRYSRTKSGEYLLMLVMANHAHTDGGGIFCSIATLAKEAHMTSRNVQILIRKLNALGELRIEPGAGPNGVHMYAINLPEGGMNNPYDKPIAKGDENFSGMKNPANQGMKNFQVNRDININKENKNNKTRVKRFAFDKDMPIPEDFCITSELYKWAVEKGYQNIDRHLDRFTAHHGAKGSKFKDWQRAYQKWVINDADFSANRQATNQQRQTYKSRKEQAKEEFDAFRDELYRSAKQPIIQPQPERDPNTRDVFDAEWTVIDGADEDPPCPF